MLSFGRRTCGEKRRPLGSWGSGELDGRELALDLLERAALPRGLGVLAEERALAGDLLLQPRLVLVGGLLQQLLQLRAALLGHLDCQLSVDRLHKRVGSQSQQQSHCFFISFHCC